jgi:hypothetical protein
MTQSVLYDVASDKIPAKGNGKDSILEALARLEHRLENVEDLLEEALEKIDDLREIAPDNPGFSGLD